jgi:PPOX class probable F420-dependent enzyme
MGRSPNVAELPGWASELLERERVGRLGFLDADGHPRVLPVTYAVCSTSLVTAIDDKPKRVPGSELARVGWLRARPRVALTVDRYDEDWAKLAWVQALGAVRVLEVGAASEELAALSGRYAAYRERPPGGPVLVLEPERLLWWRATEG